MMKTRKRGGTGSSMNMPPTTPAEGHLDKHVQVSIGAQLRKHYQQIVDEGVPDRFVDLLQRFDRKLEAHPAEGSGDDRQFVENRDSKAKDPQR